MLSKFLSVCSTNMPVIAIVSLSEAISSCCLKSHNRIIVDKEIIIIVRAENKVIG
jgi:hypothetical protein